MEDIYDIEECTNLTRRLGSRARRVKPLPEPEKKKSTRGRKPKTLANTVREHFLEASFSNGYPLWIDDVFRGIVRLDWYRAGERSIPLSAAKLVTIFRELDEISTQSIQQLLFMKERQARRYVQACAMALPFLERSKPELTGESFLGDFRSQYWEDLVDTSVMYGEEF